ncbi:dephospho-CoA kinase [Chitinibacter tainanensis]|uniref:dephospho-CoA kinase n=1 Tax=Chitinibacter tainanensis TaxID=230667 RepID=UPI00041FEA30|nr:dephospho-CoA kinase [Chitinibacter tainanensis]
MASKRPVIGLTGGIGSGKSTFAVIWQQLGIGVIDADAQAHQLSQANSPLIPQVAQAFGPNAVAHDGTLNRAWLRDAVFSNTGAKARLESIFQPAILQACLQAIAMIESEYIIFMVPLLHETPSFRAHCNATATILADTELRIRRVMQRSALSRETVVSIMNNQLGDDERGHLSDYLLYNNGSKLDIVYQVNRLHRKILAEISNRHPCHFSSQSGT